MDARELDEVVALERHADGYAVVTLNRPRAKNALSRALRARLREVLLELDAEPAVRVVILTGAGDAFCAGLDLKEIGNQGLDSDASGANGAGLDQVVAGFGGPVIGAINGVAITGGFELALACDVLLASTQARFADTHARVGVMPGWGLSQRLPRLIGPYRAKELSLTGNFIDAQMAAAWGLVNRVVAPDALLPAARALACDMLSVLPEMLVRYKRLIDDGYAMSFAEGMRLEKTRALESNPGLDAASLESRRLAVLERGRSQSGDPVS
ncbi:MAG: enoyl-CoA hydratase [Burkholderiaceae bacterium]|nr:enoyl-CoA hydratase [Burkholderiaceae bacterium]